MFPLTRTRRASNAGAATLEDVSAQARPFDKDRIPMNDIDRTPERARGGFLGHVARTAAAVTGALFLQSAPTVTAVAPAPPG
jgi:hypothetical protein